MLKSHSSFSLFMQSVYIVFVFAALFYGVLTIERIVRHVGYTNPFRTPTVPYVAVLNQNMDEKSSTAEFIAHIARDITNFWRYGN